MNRVVLDASALLALIENEPGADEVLRVMRKSAISAVNLAEVCSKLAERGQDGRAAVSLIAGAAGEVVAFTAAHAEIVGSLRPQTRHLGL